MDRRKKRKQLGDSDNDNPWKPTSDEIEVATYMYRKLPVKEARLSGMLVRVFIAEEAVSLLMESPWAPVQSTTTSTRINEKKSKPCLFSTKDAVIFFLNTMLQKQLFHRAVKIIKTKASRKKKDEAKCAVTKTAFTKKNAEKPCSLSKTSSNMESKTEDDEVLASSSGPRDKQAPSISRITSDESSNSTTLNNVSSKECTGKSSSSTKPMKIEMSNEQLFVLDDTQTVYVWIYEPPPGLFNWLAGSALLIGIILCCLFPIWPAELRSGAYYLILLASALFGLLLAVALLRLILYMICWVFTLGTYSFWLFPNYFEDCGFFESFRPLYSWTQIITDTSETKRKDKSRLKSSENVGSTNSSKIAIAPDGPKRASSLSCSLPQTLTMTDTRSKSQKEDLGKVD